MSYLSMYLSSYNVYIWDMVCMYCRYPSSEAGGFDIALLTYLQGTDGPITSRREYPPRLLYMVYAKSTAKPIPSWQSTMETKIEDSLASASYVHHASHHFPSSIYPFCPCPLRTIQHSKIMKKRTKERKIHMILI